MATRRSSNSYSNSSDPCALPMSHAVSRVRRDPVARATTHGNQSDVARSSKASDMQVTRATFETGDLVVWPWCRIRLPECRRGTFPFTKSSCITSRRHSMHRRPVLRLGDPVRRARGRGRHSLLSVSPSTSQVNCYPLRHRGGGLRRWRADTARFDSTATLRSGPAR